MLRAGVCLRDALGLGGTVLVRRRTDTTTSDTWHSGWADIATGTAVVLVVDDVLAHATAELLATRTQISAGTSIGVQLLINRAAHTGTIAEHLAWRTALGARAGGVVQEGPWLAGAVVNTGVPTEDGSGRALATGRTGTDRSSRAARIGSAVHTAVIANTGAGCGVPGFDQATILRGTSCVGRFWNSGRIGSPASTPATGTGCCCGDNTTARCGGRRRFGAIPGAELALDLPNTDITKFRTSKCAADCTLATLHIALAHTSAGQRQVIADFDPQAEGLAPDIAHDVVRILGLGLQGAGIDSAILDNDNLQNAFVRCVFIRTLQHFSFKCPGAIDITLCCFGFAQGTETERPGHCRHHPSGAHGLAPIRSRCHTSGNVVELTTIHSVAFLAQLSCVS